VTLFLLWKAIAIGLLKLPELDIRQAPFFTPLGRLIYVGIEIMDNELTKPEENTLARIELAGKWDSLIYDLSLFLPCAIIIGLSSYYGSTMGILSGLVTYGGFRIWIETQRSQLVTILQSAIRKLKSKCQQSASSKDSEHRSSS
jgi:hypothetical protein